MAPRFEWKKPRSLASTGFYRAPMRSGCGRRERLADQPDRAAELRGQELMEIHPVEQRRAGADPAALGEGDIDPAQCRLGAERQRQGEIDLLGTSRLLVL